MFHYVGFHVDLVQCDLIRKKKRKKKVVTNALLVYLQKYIEGITHQKMCFLLWVNLIQI